MPVWPFLMGFTALLAAIGWRVGAWHVPALALLGYIGMRGVIWGLPPNTHEVAGCTLWLIVAVAMGYKGGAVPGLLYALSALTYPTLLIFGFRLEYMGLSPIIAEAFAVCALLWIGGGIGGMVISAGRNPDRPMVGATGHQVSLAPRQAASGSNRP